MSIICPLFSGSTGNSTYIGTGETGILIDAGASLKGIESALAAAGAGINEIEAVAVTHCHGDHIRGLKAVLKKTGARLIGTEETLEFLAKGNYIPPHTGIVTLAGADTEINGISFDFFRTSHDSPGSCGYVLHLPDGKKFSLCTDTGIITDEIKNAVSGSDAVLLESNHDTEMLRRGPYPPVLKVRIMSDKGHISNTVCAAEVLELFKGGTCRFILGHLSLNNNTPALARNASESALMDIGAENGKDYILTVAGPDGNGVTVI